MAIRERKFNLDIIRIIAIVLVVQLHVVAAVQPDSTTNSHDFMMLNLANSISRIGVPLFLMLSGALMLNENKIFTIRKAIASATKIMLLLFTWSFIYASVYQIIIPLLSQRRINIREVVMSVFMGHYHLWYLYMLIGLYLITPILKIFTTYKNKSVVLYFIVLSILFSFIVPISNFMVNLLTGPDNYVRKLTEKFYMDFPAPFVSYYLLGWYICNVGFSGLQRKIIYGLGLVGLIITVCGVQIFSITDNQVSKIFYSNLSVNTLAYSVAVFTFFVYLLKDFKPQKEKMKNMIIMLSKLSFGVYLIHVFVITLMQKVFVGRLYYSGFFAIIALTLCISFAASYMMAKIPFLRRFIRM